MCWLQCVFSSHLDLKNNQRCLKYSKASRLLHLMMSFEPWDND